MNEFSFQALGTEWSILIDGEPLTNQEKQVLLNLIAQFDEKYSRFLPKSEANQFREAEPGKFEISEEFSEMLRTAELLRTLTKGVYDPAVGALLEHTGYDKDYRFIPDESVKNYTVPQWSIHETTLTLDGPVVLDLGGIGKGYCIDKVANFLKECSRQYFLVDAGGDMYGTEKKDGSPFQIALEWPGKPGSAFGTFKLKHSGLAVSDSFRRQWQDWHHIVNPHTKEPVRQVIGCAATAKNAFYADCITSGIFLAPKEEYLAVSEALGGEFVAFLQQEKVLVSEGWQGEFFNESK